MVKIMFCKNAKLCISSNTFCLYQHTDCCEFKDERVEIVCEENKKEYRLYNKNNSKNAKYHVDDHMIVDNDSRCDYLVINYSRNYDNFIFIELKGTRTIDAIGQILNTINIFQQNSLLKTCNSKVFVRIVNSGDVPGLRSNSKYIKLKKALFKINKEDDEKYLKIKNKKIEEKTIDL